MIMNELDQVETVWNEHADKWNRWIGDEGDANRRESSDIYLWKYIGNIENNVILDAGCGNGYLSIKLVLETSARRVIGVDISSNLLELAKQNVHRRVTNAEDCQRIELYHDSITELKSIQDNSIDLIIANYVIMDTPDLDSVMAAFQRVLKPSGRIIIVILHPCFDVVPQKEDSKRIYTWTRSYFDEALDKQEWEMFSLYIYHRSLSTYFRSFHMHGFMLVDFDEPKFFSKIHQYECTCAALFHLKKNE